MEGTFLQANIREMEECAKAAHNVLKEDIDQEPLNVRTLLILTSLAGSVCRHVPDSQVNDSAKHWVMYNSLAIKRPFRAPGNYKRRVLRHAGSYSEPCKMFRFINESSRKGADHGGYEKG